MARFDPVMKKLLSHVDSNPGCLKMEAAKAVTPMGFLPTIILYPIIDEAIDDGLLKAAKSRPGAGRWVTRLVITDKGREAISAERDIP